MCLLRGTSWIFSCLHFTADSGSIQSQSMWDLWWTKRHCDRFFCEQFVFFCQYSALTAPPYRTTGATILLPPISTVDAAYRWVADILQRTIFFCYQESNAYSSVLQSTSWPCRFLIVMNKFTHSNELHCWTYWQTSERARNFVHIYCVRAGSAHGPQKGSTVRVP